MAAAAKKYRRELVLLVLFPLVIEQFGAARDFVRAVLVNLNPYVSHKRLLREI
jgi:hypothetical protein